MIRGVQEFSHHALPFAIFALGQFGFDFGGPGGIFEGLLTGIEALVVAIFQFLWNLLVQVFTYLLQGLIFLLKFFYGLMLDIAKAFKWIWTNIIRLSLTKAIALFLRVREFLRRFLGPLIRWLQKARAILDRYFNRFVKPVLKLIRQIRQTLQIFRLLGFKWAARLDARLAQIENRIVQVWTLIRTELNKVITFLGLIADPLGILRRNPLFAAIIRSAPELQNILDLSTQHFLGASEKDTMQRNFGQFSVGAYRTDYSTYLKQGKLPPDTEASQAVFAGKIGAMLNG